MSRAKEILEVQITSVSTNLLNIRDSVNIMQANIADAVKNNPSLKSDLGKISLDVIKLSNKINTLISKQEKRV